MTNEELVIQIQAGNTQYYGELWDNTKRLLFKILKSKIAGYQLPNYLTYEDLQQEMYFTMCNAVQAYDSLKPFKFNSYLDYQVICTLRNLTAFKANNRQIKEVSYNEPIGDTGEDEIIDFIPCPSAADKFNEIEMTDIQKMVREAIADLPKTKRQIIALFYLQDKSLANIALFLKISPDFAKKEKSKGIDILRQNKALKAYYREFVRHYNHTENKYYHYEIMWEKSAEKQQAIKLIAEQRKNGTFISYGKEQILLFRAKDKYIRRVQENA